MDIFEKYWKEEINYIIDNLMDGDEVEKYYPWVIELANNDDLREKAINDAYKDMFVNGDGKFWCMISNELTDYLAYSNTVMDINKKLKESKND